MVKPLAITLGDRHGIGPEIVAALLARRPGLNAVVIGDARVFERGRRTMGISGNFPVIASLDEAPVSGWALLDRPHDSDPEALGALSEGAGAEMVATMSFVADAAKAGRIGGAVYAPLNKQAMKLAGHAAGDELELLVQRLKPETAGEINILGEVFTSRVTSHVPLRAVGDLITVERVGRSIDLLYGVIRSAGRKTPRLAVAALNPHAGEGGAFGREEIDVIAPAIAAARRRGIDATGAFPADTIFPRAVRGDFDGVVTMFHDQGQIALKMVGLGRGITLLAGFPVPIATPGHGVAYDIAGTGRAKVDGLVAAVELVGRMMMGEPEARPHGSTGSP